jgi:hypothetical protein
MKAMEDRQSVTTVTAVLCVTLLAAFIVACGSAAAQETKKYTIKGAGIGALLGQAIGHDTESTVIGGVIGAGVGRVTGKQKDKANAAQSAPPVDATPVAPAEAPKPVEVTEEPGPPEELEAIEAPESSDPAALLPGTVWRIESLQPADRVPEFFSKVVSFLPDGHIQTLTTDPAGSVKLSEESYTAVGDTLVVSLPEHSIHARFKLDGDQLIVSADDFSAILVRLHPER